MARQAIEHEGKVCIVDTDTGTYTTARPEPELGFLEVVLGVATGGVSLIATEALDKASGNK